MMEVWPRARLALHCATIGIPLEHHPRRETQPGYRPSALSASRALNGLAHAGPRAVYTNNTRYECTL